MNNSCNNNNFIKNENDTVLEHSFSLNQINCLKHFLTNILQYISYDGKYFCKNDITDIIPLKCGSFGCGIKISNESTNIVVKIIGGKPKSEKPQLVSNTFKSADVFGYGDYIASIDIDDDVLNNNNSNNTLNNNTNKTKQSIPSNKTYAYVDDIVEKNNNSKQSNGETYTDTLNDIEENNNKIDQSNFIHDEEYKKYIEMMNNEIKMNKYVNNMDNFNKLYGCLILNTNNIDTSKVEVNTFKSYDELFLFNELITQKHETQDTNARIDNTLFFLFINGGDGDLYNFSSKIPDLDNNDTYKLLNDINNQMFNIVNTIQCDNDNKKCKYFVHNDIKPENIIYSYKNNKINIKYIDFGSSQIYDTFFKKTLSGTPLLYKLVSFKNEDDKLQQRSILYDVASSIYTMIIMMFDLDTFIDDLNKMIIAMRTIYGSYLYNKYDETNFLESFKLFFNTVTNKINLCIFGNKSNDTKYIEESHRNYILNLLQYINLALCISAYMDCNELNEQFNVEKNFIFLQCDVESTINNNIKNVDVESIINNNIKNVEIAQMNINKISITDINNIAFNNIITMVKNKMNLMVKLLN
jgi:hypothetical protein